MTEGSSTQVILSQLQTLLIMLTRPIVQRQILAILAVTLLAWLLSKAILKWIHPRLMAAATNRLPKEHQGRFIRLLPATRHLYFPLIGLILIQLGVWLYAQWELTAGLIQTSAILFGIILIYRVLLALVDAWTTERRARLLRAWILIPFFIVLPLAYFLNQIVDLRSIFAIEIFQFLGLNVTVGRLMVAIGWFYVFLVLGWITEEGLRQVILPRTQADTGVINTVTIISRYLIIMMGILVVFNALGLDLTSLALIGTGLSVGIGFGLQQIIANFISGIVLLFEQSLRPGDVIEVNNQLGTVEKLNIRSTIIRTNDNVEIIVPNETFLTSQLTTFTKTNPMVRVSVPIGVSYGSDPKLIRDILMNTAAKHGLVRKDPPPFVFFEGFGESSIDFTLVIWMDEPARRRRVRSDLYYMIWDTLAKHDIEIPFPQRDLNLRGGWEEFAQTMASRKEETRPKKEESDQASLESGSE